ncbi:MAG: hypothetical protein U5K43_01700 [Halofilum sp. (in: g-proteobacteria)]|nr:hypothetical protein [Halofilum sp. (in: g-proteobacteria)]
MGVISQYRTDRLIQRLLAEDSVNSPAANEIVGKLRRDPGAAVGALLERLNQASDEQFRNITVGLYKLLDDDALEHYFDGLRSSNPRVASAVAKVLASSRRYNANRLVPLFAEPDVPKTTLIEVLSQHQDRPRRRPAAALRHPARARRPQRPVQGDRRRSPTSRSCPAS